jgi:hypothetical protein
VPHVGVLYKNDLNALMRESIGKVNLREMDDCTLQMKIGMLEKRLAALNRELLAE